VLVNRFYAIAAPETLAERAAEAIELVALSELLGDPVIAARASSVRFRSAMEGGDVAKGGTLARSSRRFASRDYPPAAGIARRSDAGDVGSSLLAGELHRVIGDRHLHRDPDRGRGRAKHLIGTWCARYALDGGRQTLQR